MTCLKSQEIFREGRLYVFTFSAHIFNDSGEAFSIDRSHSLHRKAQGDESVFISKPKTLYFEVWDEVSFSNAGDLKTNTFFLFRDTTNSVFASS